MRKVKLKFKRWLTGWLELPSDVMLDLPRLTMIGQLHVYIENHRGVLSFSKEELRLLLSQGQLHIKGEQFVIKSIFPEEILLEGKVESVTFMNGGKQ